MLRKIVVPNDAFCFKVKTTVCHPFHAFALINVRFWG
jgi:hypothetical protein